MGFLAAMVREVVMRLKAMTNQSPLADLKAIDTGIRTPYSPPSKLLNVEVESIPETYRQQDFSTIYQLRAQLGVQFQANRAQYGNALIYVESHLRHLLYGDAINALAEIRHLIMSDDKIVAVGKVSELIDYLRGAERG